MAYAVVGDVRKKAPNITLDASSKPSVSDVTDYITDVESELNAYLAAAGYTVPLTGGPETLKILREIVAQGTLAKVLQAIVAGRGVATDIGQKAAQDLYDARIQRIIKGQFVLPDEQPGVVVVQSDAVLGFSSNIPAIDDENDTDLDGNQLITRNTKF
jgi:hypothetical protein